MMNDEELGLDTLTERCSNYRFVHIPQDGAKDRKRLQLASNAFTYQWAIVCRGTSCYLTKPEESGDWNYVTKFSWTSDRRKPETDLLKLAHSRGVEGVARLIGHHCIMSIDDIRSGLTFTKSYAFRDPPNSASSTKYQPVSKLHSLSIVDRPSRKRKSVDVGRQRSKRSRSSRQKSSGQNVVTYDVEEAQGTSLLAPKYDRPYENRILRCLVISPAGRAIYKYAKKSDLETLRHAIKAHRSLYVKGNILHRDISENNIIITDPKKTGFRGVLIDLDLAKEFGSGRSGARCRTGTMEFMAIEVLLNIDHTHRHDLESFFYVLIWQCARRGWSEEWPEDSLISKWYTGTYRDIAHAKRGAMYVDGLESILEEFPPAFNCLKPLCRELRRVLFPCRDGLFVGTPWDPNVLYEPIIEAFDEAIHEVKEEDQSGRSQ